MDIAGSQQLATSSQAALDEALDAAVEHRDRAARWALNVVLGKTLVLVVLVGSIFAVVEGGGLSAVLSQRQNLLLLTLLGVELLLLLPMCASTFGLFMARSCYRNSRLPSLVLEAALETEGVGSDRAMLVASLRTRLEQASKSKDKQAFKRYLALRTVSMTLALFIASDEATQRAIADGRVGETRARVVDDRVSGILLQASRRSLIRWIIVNALVIGIILALGIAA